MQLDLKWRGEKDYRTVSQLEKDKATGNGALAATADAVRTAIKAANALPIEKNRLWVPKVCAARECGSLMSSCQPCRGVCMYSAGYSGCSVVLCKKHWRNAFSAVSGITFVTDCCLWLQEKKKQEKKKDT